MFSYCAELQEADNITINNYVANNSCANMFSRCSKLVKGPKLNATRLGSSCYNYMFDYCSSLTEAPELPATSLINGSSCYNYMFRYCTSLTTPPALPATTLNSSCYQYMFQNCTSLTHVPALPATALQSSCYANMFQGCTSLKVYAEPGEGHTKAWNIPGNGVITSSTYSQSNMFTNVQTDSVPATWPGTKGQQFVYYTEFDPVQ